MRIVTALEGDLDAAAALVNRAYRGEGARAGWTHEADLLDGPRTNKALLARALSEAEAGGLLLARAPDGQLLGCVMVTKGGEGAAEIGMLSVDPGRQDGGLGRSLLSAAEARARALGLKRARLHVIGVRRDLIAWYERRGYLRTGDREAFPDDGAAGRPLAADLDFVVLEKALGPP
jgi:ribosomal protein S18 acetylase RimI-like enzyme